MRVYWSKGSYDEAEPLHQETLRIKKTLDGVACLYCAKVACDKAEALHQEALRQEALRQGVVSQLASRPAVRPLDVDPADAQVRPLAVDSAAWMC